MAAVQGSGLVLFLIISFLSQSSAQSSTTASSPAPEPVYKYVKVLDGEGKYVLRWRYNATDIDFEVTVQTLGYIGFGISEVGLMNPADMVMAWIIDGQIYFGDYHTNDTRAPVMDQSTDWFVQDGLEINGATILRFSRKLDTCDNEDEVISRNTMNIIYCYHDSDPDITTGMVPYHGDINRGVKYVLLLEGDAMPTDYPPPDTFLMDVKNYMYPIPAAPSTLVCVVFEMKGVIPKSHMIKVSGAISPTPKEQWKKNDKRGSSVNGVSTIEFAATLQFRMRRLFPVSVNNASSNESSEISLKRYEPVIDPGHEQNVYRMTLYRCNIADPDLNGRQFLCENETTPVSVKSCKSIVASWAMGGEAFHFPNDVGVSMGGPNDPSTYVLEINYANFEMLEGLQDNSGLRVTYTTTPRLHDAGLLELGSVITNGWKQVIPEGEEAFLSKSSCSPRCMKWGFSSETTPMNAIGVLFQGNDIAKSIKLRHFRETQDRKTVELPWITDDRAFSNFYQTTRVLEKPISVYHNDTLSLECTYNSMDRQAVTRGGWSRVEETCRATLIYYPRKPFDMCVSWSSFDKLVSREGRPISVTPETPETLDTTSDITNLLQISEQRAMEYLGNVTTWDPTMKRILKESLNRSTERALCSSISRQPAYAIDRYTKPALLNTVQPPRSSCQSMELSLVPPLQFT